MSPLLFHIYSDSCWETLWLRKWEDRRGWACCHGDSISLLWLDDSLSVNVQLNIHQYHKQIDNYISWHVTCWIGTDFIQRVWRAHFWLQLNTSKQINTKHMMVIIYWQISINTALIFRKLTNQPLPLLYGRSLAICVYLSDSNDIDPELCRPTGKMDAVPADQSGAAFISLPTHDLK